MASGARRPGLTALSQAFLRGNSRHTIRPRGPPFVKTTADSGRGWYKLYEEEGPDAFNKYRPPTPYDWEASPAKDKRSKVFLEVEEDKEPLGKIVIELEDALLPMTSKNFRLLCEGKREVENEEDGSPTPVGYEGSTFSRLVKESAIVGGELKDLGNHSAYRERFFRDEGFFISHTAAGLVSMVSAGVHRNASLFYITTAPCPHLDGRAVAFGRVVEGMDVLHKIAKIYTVRGRPVSDISIAKAGVVAKR